MPEIGSGCTQNVAFWWTPVSFHQIRSLSGSSDVYGWLPCSRLSRHVEPSLVIAALPEPQLRALSSSSRHRPM